MRQTMTDARRPLHLAVMIGASTAIYAASVAGVTALQSNTDRALTLRQAPALDAVARLRVGHDRLESRIDGAAAAYERAARAYDALTPGLLDTALSLTRLGEHVASVTGAASALPERVALPPISRTVIRAPVAPRPKTNATTGASGG